MSEEKKRPRACQQCHSIKIKCELGTTGGAPPCARCLRLGKECAVAAPKRQKDRVAELEAQVEALTRLLQQQDIHPDATPGASGEYTPTAGAPGSELARSRSATATAPTPYVAPQQKKRRLDDHVSPALSDTEGNTIREKCVELDTVLPRHVQEELLARYVRDLVPFFPAVPIAGDARYESLRKERPLLLQSAIYCASFGALPIEKQEDVGKVVMDLFAAKAMDEGEKSAELIQAMQAAVLYYRTTKHHTHIAAWQFIEMAGGLAEDIGIGGPQRAPAQNTPACGPYNDSSEAWRTWLVCQMLSATLALFMRKSNASSWDARDSSNLEMLEYSYFRMDSDELLGQHVRAEHLCDTIAAQQRLYDDSGPTVDVADPAVQAGMQRLLDLVTDWRAQVPPALNGPVMAFWQHVALLYLHEPVLHTPSNKRSFSAPYIAPRISVTDFARPAVVAPAHLAALDKIRDSAHAVLDVFEAFDAAHSAALPAMYFSGRVAYAVYMLAKLYVAVTAPGNTFGAFVDPASLLLEAYLEKMTQAFYKTAAIDEWCGQARILSASFRMREWFLNYQANFPHPASKGPQSGGDFQMPGFDVSAASTLPLVDDWSTLPFVDSTQTGLEEFFADPTLSGWFPQQFDEAPVMAGGLNTEFL